VCFHEICLNLLLGLPFNLDFRDLNHAYYATIQKIFKELWTKKLGIQERYQAFNPKDDDHHWLILLCAMSHAIKTKKTRNVKLRHARIAAAFIVLSLLVEDRCKEERPIEDRELFAEKVERFKDNAVGGVQCYTTTKNLVEFGLAAGLQGQQKGGGYLAVKWEPTLLKGFDWDHRVPPTNRERVRFITTHFKINPDDYAGFTGF
jgi:hypothetical protein